MMSYNLFLLYSKNIKKNLKLWNKIQKLSYSTKQNKNVQWKETLNIKLARKALNKMFLSLPENYEIKNLLINSLPRAPSSITSMRYLGLSRGPVGERNR